MKIIEIPLLVLATSATDYKNNENAVPQFLESSPPMFNRLKIFLALLLLFGIYSISMDSYAETKLDNLIVMALGPVDGRAVVKLPDGKMQVLKLGDVIDGTDAQVLQVLSDKLIVEESIPEDDDNVRRETVWLYKSKGTDISDIKRLSANKPKQQILEKPIIEVIE